jgi:hypothetical protein
MLLTSKSQPQKLFSHVCHLLLAKRSHKSATFKERRKKFHLWEAVVTFDQPLQDGGICFSESVGCSQMGLTPGTVHFLGKDSSWGVPSPFMTIYDNSEGPPQPWHSRSWLQLLCSSTSASPNLLQNLLLSPPVLISGVFPRNLTWAKGLCPTRHAEVKVTSEMEPETLVDSGICGVKVLGRGLGLRVERVRGSGSLGKTQLSNVLLLLMKLFQFWLL